MFKKVVVSICVVALLATGCSKTQSPGPETSIAPEKNNAAVSGVKQLQPPEKGETIAIMKTTMGDIKIKFFPKEAPKTVENFIGLAKKGYYKGIIFHRVIKDFMIQGGDPQGTGTGGESLWGGNFEDEFSNNVRNYRGALSMANSGPNTNGSQFFIVQASNANITEDAVKALQQDKFSEEVINAYKNVGGTPWLDHQFTGDQGNAENGHTVFGQVFEGMDTVDKIASVETGEADKPVKDVKIEDIEITEQK